MNRKYQELGNILKAYTRRPPGPEQQDSRAFAAYLSAAIDNAGLTRAEVAERADLSPVELYALERGLLTTQDIGSGTLHRLAQVLDEDVSIFELLLRPSVADSAQKTQSDELMPGKSPLQSDSSLDMSPLTSVNTASFQNQAVHSGRTANSTAAQNARNESHAHTRRFFFPRPKGLGLSIGMGVVATILLGIIAMRPFWLNHFTTVQRLARRDAISLEMAQELDTNQAYVPPQSSDVSLFSDDTIRPESRDIESNMAFSLNDVPLPTATPLATISIPIVQNELADLASLKSAPTFNADLGVAARSTATATPMTLAFKNEQLSANPVQENVQLFQNKTSANAPAIESENAYPVPLPRDMTFYDYGINSFIAAATDPLSTFAVDVDTGSYTIARRYINEGRLPPQEAVRVEEFINYFEYGYARPQQGETFAIQMDAYPSPFDETDDVQLLRIGIQGYEVAAEERADVALTFVIDVSGSMEEGGRLTLVKRALTLLIERLRPTDTVGIVVYSTDARVLLAPTPAEQKNDILDAIYSMQPENSTNVEGGLRMGYELAWRHFNEQAINRVILASDGVANVGSTIPEQIWEQVTQYADRGITLTTIGVGMGNYNDVIMEQMADIGDGVYGYVDSIEEAERLFVDELTGTLVTIAKDAKVQVEFNPEVVTHYRLLGYENRDVADSDFRNDAVDAGEIGAGHSVTALYEVRTVPDPAGELARAFLRWQDPDRGEVNEINATAEVQPSAVTFSDAPASFQLAAVVAEFAESLRNSFYVDAQLRDQEISPALLAEAQRLSRLIGDDEDARELFRLIQEASRIVGQ